MIRLFLPAAIPILLFMYMFIRKIAAGSVITAVCAAALISVPPIIILQHWTTSFFDAVLFMHSRMVRLFLNSLITAALIEEGIKAACFYLTIRIFSKNSHAGMLKKHAHAVHSIRTQNMQYTAPHAPPYQCILLGILFGLVFGSLENLSYSLRYPASQYIRVLTATVLHGMLGCFYAIMLHTRTKGMAVLIFSRAVFIHGFYNFFISLHGFFIVPAFALLGIAGIYAQRLYRAAKNLDS